MSDKTKINVDEPIKTSWDLFKKNIGKLLPIYVLLNLPVVYSTYVADQRAEEYNENLNTALEAGEFEFSIISDYVLGSAFSLETILSGLFVTLATLFVSLFIYQVVVGEKTTINKVFESIKKNIVSLLIAYVILNIASTIGIFLLIIPGFLISLFGMFTYQEMVIENKSPFKAYKSSMKLVNKETFGAIGYILLIGLIVGLISAIISLFTGVLFGALLSIPITMFGSVFNGVFYAKRREMDVDED